jgi:mono/diheme cytochrome c family protein
MGRSLARVIAAVLVVAAGVACSPQSGSVPAAVSDPAADGSTEVAVVEEAEVVAVDVQEEPNAADSPVTEQVATAPAAAPQPTPAPAPSPAPAPAPAAQPAAPAAAGPVSIRDGVYTAAQATRGQQIVQRECASCHSPTEWNRIAQFWSGRSAYDLTNHIRNVMPLDAPGRLPWQAYTDIVAYMFQLNQMPVGQQELPTDESRLQAIRIEARR